MQWPQQAQQDLNLQHSGSEPDTLPIELYASPDERNRTSDLPDISRMRCQRRHIRLYRKRRQVDSNHHAAYAVTRGLANSCLSS